MNAAQSSNLILVRIGEIALKGLNRNRFVQQLIRNIHYRIDSLGEFKVREQSSRIWVQAISGNPDMSEVIKRLCEVFGIVSVSPVIELAFDFSSLEQAAIYHVGEMLEESEENYTFKVETRRVNKSFPLDSYGINSTIGAKLLEAYPDRLKVDVHHPDFILQVEVRNKIYLYHRTYDGPAGLPSGMSGKGVLLLSGGIDSPVAGYLMASRGMTLDAIYFHTFPYTSQQALEKVEALTKILSRYSGAINFHLVDFTDTQLEINDNCPEDMMTIVMRRVMFRVAEKVALQEGAKCLITGESLGQVASQTLEALNTTNSVVNQMPIFRPLIGLDKNETIDIARKIGSYETSILPYEDCCTVFVSKHPKTHPSFADAEKAEANLNMEELLNKTLGKINSYKINYY